ncbi:hypothetical protein [Bdellovibrio bacteriovorus]|uniref:hypothetical protein n=1 Tax=Bdellovibrio bacteriovorus TaxID=959 RepID=UPI0035A73978
MINTPYVQKLGTDLPWAMKVLKDHKLTKKYMTPLIHLMGMKSLEEAAVKPTWKTVWSAGQSVGLVEEILTVQEIYQKLIAEYDDSVKKLSSLGLE